MGFQPCPNIVQLEHVIAASNEICENVYHVKCGSAPSSADLTTLCNTLDAWDVAHLAGARSTQTFAQRIIATDLTTATGARIIKPVSPTRVGSAGGNPLPNNATLAIKLDTGLRGRSNRGRVYHIGITDAALGTGEQVVTSAYAGNIASVYQALITAIAGAGSFQLCVLSRKTGGAFRANGIGTPIISAVLADPFIDSQRRRLPSHNRHH